MAEFDVDFQSFGDMIQALQGLDMFDDETQSKLLNAGSELLMDTIQEEAGRSPYRLKNILAKLSRSSKPKTDKSGMKYVEVTVSGKNERGERNATVAFVLNYGRSKKFGKITGSYFWTRAVKRAEKGVLETYEDVITEQLKERKLI